MDNASEEIRRIYRFRFATDGGDAYAVAVLDDGLHPEHEVEVWRVGFAFRAPRDERKMIPRTISVNGDKVKKLFDLGYLIAENRAGSNAEKAKAREDWQGPYGLTLSDPANIDIPGERAYLLREQIVAHVLRVIDIHPLRLAEHLALYSLSDAFGLRSYMGKKPGDFEQWITGKFADQFRTRYAGGE